MGNNLLCCQIERVDLKQKAEVNTDRNFKSQNKKNSTNENIVKQVTEANDNLSIIDIRKRDFYEVKDNTNNKNVSINKISDFENKNISLLDYINYSPKLKLEVVNSSVLPQGMILKINALGLENSVRKQNDGVTYFGYQDDNSDQQIDFILRPKDNEYDEKYVGKHFQIYYDSSLQKYYLKDLGNGFGTFVKINTETILKNNSLINIGDSYIVCQFGMNEETLMSESHMETNKDKMGISMNMDHINMINIKIFSGNKKYDPLNFQPTKSVIKFGRSADCEVIIEDSMLSRIHCSIEYKENFGWIIRDGYQIKKGFNYENKYSTNGTWLFAMDDTMISEGMIFKANHNLFKCTYN